MRVEFKFLIVAALVLLAGIFWGTVSAPADDESASIGPVKAGTKSRVMTIFHSHGTLGKWLTETCDPDQRFVDKHYCTEPGCKLDDNGNYNTKAAWDFTNKQRKWKHLVKDSKHNFETVVDDKKHQPKEEVLDWNTVVLAGTQPYPKSRAMGWRLYDNPNDKTLAAPKHHTVAALERNAMAALEHNAAAALGHHTPAALECNAADALKHHTVAALECNAKGKCYSHPGLQRLDHFKTKYLGFNYYV